MREKSEAVKELKSKYAEKLPDDAKPLKDPPAPAAQVGAARPTQGGGL